MTRELTKQEFLNTTNGGMLDVTGKGEPVIDIWGYVLILLKEEIVTDHVFDNNLVEKVYRNASNTYEHMLLPTADKAVFNTIVVDIAGEFVYGHYQLNLNKEPLFT
jgi:hypothetical protein